MTKDEALKLALEALEADPLEMVADANGHMVFLKDKAITAIKAALAQPVQEPPSEWAGIKAILDEYGLQAIDFVADFKAALKEKNT